MLDFKDHQVLHKFGAYASSNSAVNKTKSAAKTL